MAARVGRRKADAHHSLGNDHVSLLGLFNVLDLASIALDGEFFSVIAQLEAGKKGTDVMIRCP